jgi:hypothetical protein
MQDLEEQGYGIIPSVFSAGEIADFRLEADRVAEAAGSACVRHLRARSPLFHDLATSPRLLALIPAGLIPVRSILFDKTPEENWPVAWHQDLTITVAEKVEAPGYGPWSFKDGSPHVQPPVQLLSNMATIRIHLDDTPAENGALMVAPGSHRSGRIPPGEIAAHTGSPVTCGCGRGDVLLMSPLILHASRRSVFPQRRRVVHFEYAKEGDLAEGLRWYE